MEEDFLDLGFVDPSFLQDMPDAEPEKKETDETKEVEEKETKEPEETNEEPNKATEEKQEVDENPKSPEQGSPNISSSIALTLVEDGVLQTLDSDRVAQIKTVEDLIEAFREDQRNQLDERQKRIDEALNYGVEPTKIQRYEQWIQTLDNVTDEILDGEEEQNENYRKNLIYQSYMIKGFDKEDALEMVNRSVDSGKDIDDAKKALSSLKKYYQKAYTDEVDNAKKEYEKHVASQKKQLEDLRSSIIDDKENFYEQFEVGKALRQKIFDTVAKPTITDGDKKLTPIQKFIKDDPNKANKIIGTLYVLTDGFTKFDGILKGEVKKEIRKSKRDLERLLNQTGPIDASLQYKSGLGETLDDTKIVDFAID